MKQIIEFITNKNIYISIAIIVIGTITYIILKRIMKKMIEKNKNNPNLNNRKRTYIRLINSILKYVILIIVCVAVLQVNGVNVTSIVAGLGLVSVIAGLALQDALKDIIMGFNIIVDDYFSVGDVLQIGEVQGKVIELGLKSTKLKDVNNGNTLIISNRSITDALTISNQIDIDLPLPYEEPITKIEEIIGEIINNIKHIENVTEAEYKGLYEFGEYALYYKIRILCKPETKLQVRTEANRIIKFELDKNNIQIPYKQVVVHTNMM